MVVLSSTIYTKLKLMIKIISLEFFSRANHIYYQKIESCVATIFSDIIKQSFTMKLQSFSCIDTKVEFDVNLSQGELQPNKEAQK